MFVLIFVSFFLSESSQSWGQNVFAGNSNSSKHAKHTIEEGGGLAAQGGLGLTKDERVVKGVAEGRDQLRTGVGEEGRGVTLWMEAHMNVTGFQAFGFTWLDLQHDHQFSHYFLAKVNLFPPLG